MAFLMAVEEQRLSLITTESVEVAVPLPQVKVKVVGVEVVGYQGWPDSIGPPTPEREMPDSPVGELKVQEVAPVEVQL